MNRFDIAEAYKWWDVLRDGNQLTEIRLISNDGKTASGIFDSIDEITIISGIPKFDSSLYD